MCVLMNNVRAR